MAKFWQYLTNLVKFLVDLVISLKCSKFPSIHLFLFKSLKGIPIILFSIVCIVGYRENNFPPLPAKCPCKPCFFNDISIDIPVDYQRTCRALYIRWQGTSRHRLIWRAWQLLSLIFWSISRAWKKCCPFIRTSRFSCWASSFSLSHATWVKAQPRQVVCQQNRKKSAKTCPGPRARNFRALVWRARWNSILFKPRLEFLLNKLNDVFYMRGGEEGDLKARFHCK